MHFTRLSSKELDISSTILSVFVLPTREYPWDIFFLHTLAEMGHGNSVYLA